MVADSCRLVEKHKNERIGRLVERYVSMIVAIDWLKLLELL